MAFWMVRAGRHGESEQFALAEGVAVIGWDDLPDLSTVQSRDDLAQLMQQTYPDKGARVLGNWTGQVWAFIREIKTSDLVAIPLKTTSTIAVGEVTGEYQHRITGHAESLHLRPVKWLNAELPRSAFDQDILYSLGSLLTVCQIRRNNAETRVRAMLEGKPTPPPEVAKREGAADDTGEETFPDLEQYAKDQIRNHISHKFRGRSLERLIAELLRAQGYKVLEAPEGPDGGVDIIAGRGPMGFEPPRLCVQVKSSDIPLDVGALRELQGVMKNFGADQGLLVSWGGFKQSVSREARRLFFEVRLWDAGDVVTNVQQHFEELPDDLQAELPLKRIWALATEE